MSGSQSDAALVKNVASVGMVDAEKANPKAVAENIDDDPSNPYNWPAWRKVSIGVISSTSQLITTMSASMIAPALGDITRDLHINPTTGQIVFSIFFLGLSFAPMVLAPLSEIHGRRPVWLAGNVWYMLWNALCPVGHRTGIMVVGRLLSASGASVGVTLTTPVLSDMYHAKDRGKSLAVAGLVPYLGMALGPIVGGLAAQHLRWEWLFWILSLFDGLCFVLGYFFLHETYGPVLERKNNGKAGKNNDTPFLARLTPRLKAPFQYLFLRPAVTLCALAAAVDFGAYTLTLSIYASLWIDQYGQSPTTASLHYIAISVGTIIAAQLGGPLMDFVWRRMKASRGEDEPALPEFRVPHMVIGAVPGTSCLFLFAWAGHLRWHWFIADFGVAVFAGANFMFTQGVLAYLVDEFGSKRAASAGAAMRLPSYVLGFAFPIFAPNLQENLGYGLGISILGIVFGVIALVTVAALWFYGEKLRAIGRRDEDE